MCPRSLDVKTDNSQRGKHTEGFVLLSVLSVIAVLSTLTVAATMSVRSGVAHAGVERQLVQAGAIADAGLVRIVGALKVNDKPLLNKLADRASPLRWHFAEQEVLLSLTPETGKIDLNSGDPNLVVSVLKAVVRDDALADALLRRLDQLRRNGQDLETVRGLLDSVDRIGPLAHDLEAVFTVWTSLRGVNPKFAPEVTLRHLPGLQKGEGDLLVQARERGSYSDLSPFVSRLGALLQADRPIYRARSQVTIEGVTAQREMLFMYNSTTQAVLVVFWRDVMD